MAVIVCSYYLSCTRFRVDGITRDGLYVPDHNNNPLLGLKSQKLPLGKKKLCMIIFDQVKRPLLYIRVETECSLKLIRTHCCD